MKIPTFSTLFGFLASVVGTSNSLPNSVDSDTSVPPNTNMSTIFDLDPDFDSDFDFDPSDGSGKLSLLGFDPSEPLTEIEAVFLEATIREVFNSISDEMDIDLVSDSVTVAKDGVLFTDGNGDNNSDSNLRGKRRRKLPWNDREMCTYQSGPNVGKSIPGCIFDIDFYMDCYCHLCRDDDFIWDGNQITNPTQPPPPKPARSPTTHPVAPPSVVGCNMCRDDDFTFDGNNIYKPTKRPIRAPTVIPVSTLVPIEEEDDVGLEEERGHVQPPSLIYVRPPPSTSAPFRSRPNKIMNNKNRNKPDIDFELLKKLQQSPFRRFHKIKKVRLGGRN